MRFMNPVRGQTMLNFLNWVARNRPEVQSLSGLSNSALLDLADDFESGKLKTIPDLKRKWEASFDFLLKGNTDWDGYAAIRGKLRN
jgi:hypothetical protein